MNKDDNGQVENSHNAVPASQGQIHALEISAPGDKVKIETNTTASTDTNHSLPSHDDFNTVTSLKNDKKNPKKHQQSITKDLPPCDKPSLFVGGLHPRIGDLHLQKLFSPYGTIVRIHVATNNPSLNINGIQNNTPRNNSSKSKSKNFKSQIPSKYVAGLQQSKGYAFVEYNSVESARLAIARLNGRTLMGKTLVVKPSRKKRFAGIRGIVGESNSSGKASEDNIGAIEIQEAKREYSAVQSKIEAVKRAIEGSKREER